MDRFIFWCLKRLAVLKVKYTKHPEGCFQMGASVVVKGVRYPFIFESNIRNGLNQKQRSDIMREILFKAKRIDNGEWVQGSYAYTFNEDKACHIIGVMVENHWIIEESGNIVIVDKNTICQYTGLTDKNGNKIWENDIVDTHNRGHGYSRLERVIYENGGFFPISTHGWECEPDADEIEVIGNVFDNKELFKE